MNRTKKRAQKRSKRNSDSACKAFWQGYYSFDNRMNAVKYVRKSLSCTLNEAMEFVKRHPLIPVQPLIPDLRPFGYENDEPVF